MKKLQKQSIGFPALHSFNFLLDFGISLENVHMSWHKTSVFQPGTPPFPKISKSFPFVSISFESCQFSFVCVLSPFMVTPPDYLFIFPMQTFIKSISKYRLMKLSQLKIVYQYILVCMKNIRIPVKTFHKQHSSYRAVCTTTGILKEAKAEQILIGPYTYVNTGTDVELKNRDEKDFSISEKWIECTSDPKVTYINLLSGGHSLLIFKDGANVLSYAEPIIPTFNSKKKIEEIWPEEKGRIKPDLYPHGWGQLDWEVFHEMRNPYVSYPSVAKKLNVSTQTVMNRFRKIMKDCKPWVAFFPKGLMNYFHLFLTFKTEYEIGIKKELKKLDRTSFIYKYEDTMMIFLYSHHSRDHSVFMKMENEGIIHDLRVSIPSQWEKPWFEF